MINKDTRIIDIGILIFIFFLPIIPPIGLIGLLLALIGWLLKERGKFLHFIKPRIFQFALLGLIFTVFLSVIFSQDLLTSIGAFFLFLFYIFSCCLLLKYTSRKTINALILSGLVITIFGVIQYLTNFDLKIKTDFFSMTFRTQGGISSTLHHPNPFSQYLVLTLPFGLTSLFGNHGKLEKTLACIFVILGIYCLFLTKSLAAIGTFFILLLIILWIKNWKIGILVTLGISIFGGINNEKLEKISLRFTSSTSQVMRVYNWKEGALPIIKDYPIVGCGLGAYMKTSSNYLTDEKLKYRPHAYSLYLHYLAEIGILGFATFIFLLLTFFIISASKIKRHHFSNITTASILSISSILIVGIVEPVLNYYIIGFLFWTIIGIGIKEYNA